MKRIFGILIFIFLLLGLFTLSKVGVVQADRLSELQNQIAQYEKELERIGNQATTLKGQIAQFDAQIKLTALKITETEEKINLLGGRIDTLEVSLKGLTDAFSERAVETYKMSRLSDPVTDVLSSSELSQALLRYNYLQRIQDADRSLLI
jgi:peptidoglycan hydrolase CwlO-like protein